MIKWNKIFGKKVYFKKVIVVENMDYLDVLKSKIVSNLHDYFGIRWSLDNSEKDEERALAIAISCLYDLGGQIVSNDESVNSYVSALLNERLTDKFYLEEK